MGMGGCMRIVCSAVAVMSSVVRSLVWFHFGGGGLGGGGVSPGKAGGRGVAWEGDNWVLREKRVVGIEGSTTVSGMGSLDSFHSFLENRFRDQIHAKITLPSQPGDLVPFPAGLNPVLQQVLVDQGISSLYSHQEEAFTSIRGEQHTVLVAQTASGKTLSFLLPILDAYMAEPTPFSVLLLYPTKALSRDQEGTLGRLLSAASSKLTLGTFDGDTPQDERTRIQRSADFVLTNPDMLHSGILPNHHRRWKAFLSRLRYIVIDEVHTYRGAFGSHVANVFRRLLRVCEMHGSKPTFVCSSATIGNPKEHVEALLHNRFAVIDRDGSPRPQRRLYLMNPPVVQSAGFASYRKGPGAVAVPLIHEATRERIRTICFCRARQQVERLRRSVQQRYPETGDRVQPYRGGLLPNERRKLERDLFAGRLNTIISTNALELGIDIGDLELCILVGHPGSFASFWQQAGRVGRKGSAATIVFVAKDTPIDQYLVNHSDFILGAPVERAWLNADNPYVLMQHLPCAAHEHPLNDAERWFPEPSYTAARTILAEEKTLVPYHNSWRYALRDYPARGVNLRGMTDYNIEIYCGTEVIGEIDPIGARSELYKDAIYQHLGRRYMSLDLDLEKKLCQVEEVQVDYYTECVWESRVALTEVEEQDEIHGSQVEFGPIHVNRQPKLYKKIRERSFENIGYGPITLDPFVYDTTGLCLLPARSWREAMEESDKRYVSAALFGLSYILRHAAPSLCLSDRRDLETDVSLIEVAEGTWRSALYLFDRLEGGIGFSEHIFGILPQALALCRDMIRACPCGAGCPACVPPLPPGVEDEELQMLLVESNASVACTVSLLDVLLEGRITLPAVQEEAVRRPQLVRPPEEDEAAKIRAQRMRRAAGIMKQKRDRLH